MVTEVLLISESPKNYFLNDFPPYCVKNGDIIAYTYFVKTNYSGWICISYWKFSLSFLISNVELLYLWGNSWKRI